MLAGGLWMSKQERDRCYLIRQTVEARLSQKKAAERLGSACASSSVLSGVGGGW